MDMMVARLSEQSINDGIVESPLLGLKLLPIDRHFNGVGVQVLNRRPDFGKHGRPRAGVIHLRAQYQIRRTIDQHSVAATFLHDARQGPVVRVSGLRLRLSLSWGLHLLGAGPVARREESEE